MRAKEFFCQVFFILLSSKYQKSAEIGAEIDAWTGNSFQDFFAVTSGLSDFSAAKEMRARI